MIPSNLPKYLYPLTRWQSTDDVRKVIIIGSGPAGMSAAENLRKLGFSGSIDIFTKGKGPTIQKQNLTKILHEEGNEHLLFNRNDKYW